MTEVQTDVVIIGAGPVGLFAVFELGMLQLRCHVVDALDRPGGQCRALYPEKPIYDIPGHPVILAGELADRLKAQAAPFRPTYHLGETVTGLVEQAGSWLVETGKGTCISCRAVIIAAGGGAFGPNRLPMPGVEAFEGVSLHYSVTDRGVFAGKKLVIAGGGDSALDWVLELAGQAASVALVHRREKFRAAPASLAKLEALVAAGKVEKVVPFQLHGLEGAAGRLDTVVVRALDGKERRLSADHLLAFFGLSMDLGPIAEWGLHVEGKQVTVDPATCETARPGLFAVGDINTYPGKLKLILTGFSEAAMAAHAIYPLVHPDKALHWEYSTTKGLPED